MAQHLLPPIQCSSNTVAFTDQTLVAGSIKVRNNHIEELRTQIEAECIRRGIAAPPSWSDTALIAGAIKIRNDHMTELRTQLEQVRIGRGETGYCSAGNTVSAFSWTDTLISSIKVRNNHVEEMRTAINALKLTCICETEQCDYCADCGYRHIVCSDNGVACNNSQSVESCGYNYLTGPCGSRNTGGTHPFKIFTTGGVGTAWDGYVPWTQGDGIPPAAIAWVGTPWTCKCNPFSWAG